MPYGESFVSEHTTSTELPYLFNGKPLDEETGLYYYGARYFTPSEAVWYGVDELAEKHLEIGAYVYCAANPIKLIDADGRDWYSAEDGNRKWFDSQRKSMVRDGITYSNIGAENFRNNNDGTTTSYYQNVGLTSNVEIDVKTYITSLKNQYPSEYKRLRGKLPDYARAEIHKDQINKGSKKAFYTGVAITGNALNKVGKGIKYLGYGISATGIGAGIGAGISGLGSAMSNTGSAMEGLVDMVEGRNAEAIYKWGSAAVSTAISFGVKNSGMDETSQTIFNVWSNESQGVINYGIQKGIEQQQEATKE